MARMSLASRLTVGAPRRAMLATPAAFGLVAAGFRPAPARLPPGTFDLLVRGDAYLPAGESVAWRVVEDVAEVAPGAAFERRALGFAVNSSIFGALLVTDEATGTAFRLAPGEAAFTPDGVSRRRESIGRGPASFLRIGLVPAGQASDAGGDRLRLGSPAFAAPSGLARFALLRAPLADGAALALQASDGDALAIVEQGEAILDTAAGPESLVTTVGSDTAYAIRSVAGAARLVGRRVGTSVLLAVFE